MDYLDFGLKKFFVLDYNDCVDISYLGYEYFELIFNESDWNYIKQLPMDGLCFEDSRPKVVSYMWISTNKSLSYLDRSEHLLELKKRHEIFLLDNELAFPCEEDPDLFYWRD